MAKITLQLADALGYEVADKRLDILRRIGEVGSISEAARGAGVSYKAAWQAIDTLSNLAGTALLERMVGGSGGGGAQLTPAGLQLLAAADQLSSARAQVFAQLARDQTATFPRLAGLGMRTSMRNQLPCTVRSMKAQGAVMRVQLALPDGTPLWSRITRESVELLGLQPDLPVLALCKATAVTVTQVAESRDGCNALKGRATRVSRAAAGGEIALELASGLQLVGFSEAGIRFKVNAPVVASVNESAVVIALIA